MTDVNIRITVDSAGAVSGIKAVSGAVEDFDHRVSRADGTLREFEKGIGSFRRAILGVQSAILGFGLANLVRDLIRVNVEFDRVRYALLAGSNSAQAAAADFAWVREEAVKLGAPLNKVGLEYAKLTAAAKGTALQGQPVRDIFSSVGKASMAMGIDIAHTQRIFMALSQMLSKGKVQAEEARQQFGEHLPGGFKALAKAAGFDAVKGIGAFSKALEKGQVDAVEMLSKLPAVLDEMFGAAFEAALVSSPQMALNQFKAVIANVAYELGQSGGFMREFVGMVRDMQNVLASDKGQEQIKGLAEALGQLMHVVRVSTNFILTNIREVVAAIAGLGASSIIIGIRGLMGWFAHLAGASTLVGALVNPWVWLAVAVGTVVAAILAFGSNLLTIGKYTARGTDWLISGFNVLGGEIEKASANLEAFIKKLPVIGPIFGSITASVREFFRAMGDGSTVGAALGKAAETFRTTLRAGLGPELFDGIVAGAKQFMADALAAAQNLANGLRAMLSNVIASLEPAMAPLRDLGTRLMNGIGVAFGALLTGISALGSALPAITAALGPILAMFGTALGATLSNTITNVTTGFQKLLDVAEPTLTRIVELMMDIGSSDTFQVIIYAAIAAAVMIGNVFLGTINAIGAGFRLLGELWAIFAEAISPVIEPALRAIGDTVDWLVTRFALLVGLAPETGAWDVLIKTFADLYDIVGYVVAGVMGLVSVVASIAAPIIEALRMIVSAVANVVESTIVAVAGLFQNFNSETTKQTAQATESNSNFWIKAGDIIIGVLLSIIRVVGMVIKIIGTLAAAIIEVAGRIAEVLGGAANGFIGLITGDMSKVQAAGKELSSAFTRPLNADFKGAAEDAVSTFKTVVAGEDFSVVSKAVGTMVDTKGSMDRFGDDFGKGFKQMSLDGIAAGQNDVNAAARDAGQSTGDAYVDGLMTAWGSGAQGRMKAELAARARMKKAQDELAQQQSAAWAADNAAVDRSARADPIKSGGGAGKGRKSASQKAQDLIDDLRAEQATLNALSAQIEHDPFMNDDSVKAIRDAQQALKRAGFEISYGEAQSTGGMAKQLADVAYSASIARQELQRYENAQDEISKSVQAVSALKEQVTITQDLSLSSNELAATLAAQQAIRQKGFQVTYQEAKAVDALGNSLHPVEKALGDAAYAQEIWNREARAATVIANDLRGFTQMRNEMTLLVNAVDGGTAALDRAQAEIDAQQAVMKAYGDEVFDATRLQDANTRSLYEQAKAMSLAGGSADSFAKTLKEINDAYERMRNPAGAAATAIQDEASRQQQKLDAGLAAAAQRRDEAMSSDALFSDPTNITSNIDKALADYETARIAYQQASAKLAAMTAENIQRTSNDWRDASITALRDFGAEAEDVSGNVQDIWNKSLESMTDALTEFVMTGKLDFASLAKSIIADITRMIVKWLIWQAIKMAARAAGIPMFEDGGTMSSAGPGKLDQQKYARGGIANSPQMAIFGEGSTPEAYVPLPDGRTIPVTLSGGQSATQQIINVNMLSPSMPDHSGMYDPSSRYGEGGNSGGGTNIEITNHITVEGGGGSGKTEDNEKLADAISKRLTADLKTQIISTVQNELRPGGTFNKMGSSRPRF